MGCAEMDEIREANMAKNKKLEAKIKTLDDTVNQLRDMLERYEIMTHSTVMMFNYVNCMMERYTRIYFKTEDT